MSNNLAREILAKLFSESSSAYYPPELSAKEACSPAKRGPGL